MSLPGDDAAAAVLQVLPAVLGAHGEGLPRPCLSVGKHRRAVVGQNLTQYLYQEIN